MYDYIPYQAVKNEAAGQGMRMLPGTPTPQINLLGTVTQKSVPRVGKTKYSKDLLQYPDDVTDGPDMGHYLLFHISQIDKGKIVAQDKANKAYMAKFTDDILAEMGTLRGKQIQGELKYKGEVLKAMPANEVLRQLAIDKLDSKTPKAFSKSKYASAKAGMAGRDTTSLQAQSPRTRHKTTIALYMPPTVSVSYNSRYGEQEIGMMAQLGADAIKAFSGGASDEAVSGMLDKAGAGLKNMALAALDTVAPGAKALAAIETGKIVAPRMELMFEGIGRRSFSYEFTFIPRSEQEAFTIEKIVRTFKLHMASNLVKGTGGKEYSIPDTFEIAYMYKGNNNDFLNKISTCVLETMDVSYGGDKYVTYPMTVSDDGTIAGPPPQSTKVSLTFQELELITKDMIEQGY